jgi:hypothetical protein
VGPDWVGPSDEARLLVKRPFLKPTKVKKMHKMASEFIMSNLGLIKASEDEFEANYALDNACNGHFRKIHIRLRRNNHWVSSQAFFFGNWTSPIVAHIETHKVEEEVDKLGRLTFVPGASFDDVESTKTVKHGSAELQNIMKEYYNAALLKELNWPFLLKELLTIVFEYSKYEMSAYTDISCGILERHSGLTFHCDEDRDKIRRMLEQRRYTFIEKTVSADAWLYTDIKPACSLLKPFDVGTDPKWSQLSLARASVSLYTS